MVRKKWHSALLLTVLSIALPIILLFSVGTGPVAIAPMDILAILSDRIGLLTTSINEQSQLIIESIRLPRTLMGIMVGAALAVAGASMQGIFRNPLADPSIIGVAGGASLGAGIAIVLGGVLFASIAGSFIHSFSVSLLAFVGGMLSTWIVYRTGTTSNGTSVATMLLAGVAINALSGAGMGVLTYLADDTALRSLSFWQMGSLGGATWNLVLVCAVVLLPATLVLCRCGQVINAILLGESEARHLGINVQWVKLKLITLCAIIVGVAVSVSGFIGFIGLVVPHLIRLMVGPDHRVLLPASALLGGIILTAADMIARTIVAPSDLPIGIVTALMGAPFFMSMLWQQRQRIA
ncbi:FecCD family ABC transporter permease [Candidatus Sororendozoicomonas aggregata]|uniref:FecCD family ABC transporter permease n=1 Tax=Candidatus Sororendozoicomonas aggregata TaxID=3073239 RepID=UPI002ED34C79